jgi:hypothetical protein
MHISGGVETPPFHLKLFDSEKPQVHKTDLSYISSTGTLDATPLRRAAAVVRDRRDVLNGVDVQAG